jgi:outer membrane protein insertion porin family
VYADDGYAYADVTPRTQLDREQKEVALTFQINKGSVVYFDRISIEGNMKTRDRVIRRELKVAEGERYSATQLRKSRQRVKRTRLFKEVDFAVTPTGERDTVDLDIRVEETETGALQFGAGYSSVFGVTGIVALSQRNLFGYGYKASVKAEIGESVSDFRLGFTNPRVFDGPISAGFDLYNEEFEYDEYDARNTGGDIELGMELTDNITTDLTYQWERVRIFDIDETASQDIKDERGTTTTSGVILGITRNTIDDPFNPSRGSEVRVTGGVAGPGGDNYFYKGTTKASWFHPLIGDLVLNLRGNAGFAEGYNGEEVPLQEKYYVGGGRTLRGFEYGRAGPVDEKGDPQGAEKFATFTTELTYPLSKAIGLKGVAFYDVGKGFDDFGDITPINHAVGLGFRWYSPAGPISIDWGYNLDPEGREKTSVWDFSMGVVY